MEKTVFITGSSRGIGFETARLYAENSYNVIINCKSSKDQLMESYEILKKIHPNIMAVMGDVSDYTQCVQIFEKIKNAFSGIDILINNAGVSHVAPFNDTNSNDWDYVIKNNLYSVLNCSRLAMNHMINKKDGAIINISSIWGICGASCEAIYSASKGGVNAFTKALARELGPSNIRVNAISCGVIDTAMNNNLNSCEKEALKGEIPLMRFGTCAEVSDLIYNISLNKYITGQIITIDGGMI